MAKFEIAKERYNTLKQRTKEHGIGYYLCPPRHVKFLLWVLLAGLVSFSLIRITLLLRNIELLNSGIDATTGNILYSLLTGVRFDIVLVYYIVVIGLVLLAIGQFMGRHARWMGYATIAILSLCFSLSLMCCIGDIPYFEYTGSHVSAFALRYAANNTSESIGLITGDMSYLIFMFVALGASVAFTALILFLARRYQIGIPSERRTHAAAYLILLIALVPLTSRGMYPQRGPMTPRDAVISNNNFINQLSLNPVLPFVESLLHINDMTLSLMDSAEARAYVINLYHRDENFNEHIEAHDSPWRNVVIIVQEGNCAANLAHHGATRGLLPNLDRLIKEGRYYENTYSTGTFTRYGIYSIVTSMPSPMHLSPLEDGYLQNMHSPYDQVQSSGRMSTIFLITHTPDFDNVNGFVTMQGFDRLISLPDYNRVVNDRWGVDDHIMFDRAIKEMDAEYAAGNAFATICLTCTNHRPYNPPTVEGFNPTVSGNEERAIQYADWAMNRFIEMCKEKPWFDETLFVITADHARSMAVDYFIPETSVHIPLLFYSPKHIEPEICSDLASQMDITPTAMSMLGIEYDNHSFGIDLTTKRRSMIPISDEYHIMVRDFNWVYITNPSQSMGYLYDLNAEGDGRLVNIINRHPDIASKMDRYARAITQAGWDMHNDPNFSTNQYK